jgi:hypothetical protein
MWENRSNDNPKGLLCLEVNMGLPMSGLVLVIGEVNGTDNNHREK